MYLILKKEKRKKCIYDIEVLREGKARGREIGLVCFAN